ncbi:hypothetical protein DVH24_038456 [Malus domestica]|uniref:Fe2OG dioxygenase domain-containing protein n=1 Tax=Malus domestica TaxID=3750 RepID=A0A498KF60_MALDO|nr:hypothetical protein DVH24_038456 [Malus domestica]
MASESYPPPFRSLPDSTQAVDLDDQVNPVHDMEDPIPVVDLQSLKLGEACEFWGIFRLVNHGVPPTLLTQLRENAKMVFFLPFESKQNLITSPLSYFWGTPALTPSGAALSTKGSSTLQNINWVEGLNVPLAQLSQFQTDNPIIASFRLPSHSFSWLEDFSVCQFAIIIIKQHPAQQEDDDLHCSEKKMASESYPPPFPSSPDSTQAVDLDDQVNPVHGSEDPIPVVDLQSLKLGEACEFWGIFRLVNHGVPPTLLTQLREHAKNALCPNSGTPALTPSLAALSTKGSSTLQNINWVEGLNVPLAQLSQFQTDNPIILLLSGIFLFIGCKPPAQQEEDDLRCSEKKMASESYPPPFRSLPDSTQAVDLDDQVNPVHDSEDPIPVVDLQSLKLGEACEFWGIFRLVNHGVPPTLLTQLREHAKMVFSLPFESKQSLITNPLSYFWGTPALTPSGAALSTKGSSTLQNINWVEGLNVPLAQLSFQIDNPIIASFSLVLEEYGKHLARLATTIFDAMVINLGLDPIESKSHLSNSTGIVRVYRYPPHCSNSSSASAWGMDVHTDSSVLSILNQDEVGGLEVLKDNEWFSVNPIPNTLIVNLGDMMQAISDDKYKSVKHRVKVNRSKERVSICYFVFPGEGSVIRSSNYKPFTYRDFQNEVQQDIKSVGYKVSKNLACCCKLWIRGSSLCMILPSVSSSELEWSSSMVVLSSSRFRTLLRKATRRCEMSSLFESESESKEMTRSTVRMSVSVWGASELNCLETAR